MSQTKWAIVDYAEVEDAVGKKLAAHPPFKKFITLLADTFVSDPEEEDGWIWIQNTDDNQREIVLDFGNNKYATIAISTQFTLGDVTQTHLIHDVYVSPFSDSADWGKTCEELIEVLEFYRASITHLSFETDRQRRAFSSLYLLSYITPDTNRYENNDLRMQNILAVAKTNHQSYLKSILAQSQLQKEIIEATNHSPIEWIYELVR